MALRAVRQFGEIVHRFRDRREVSAELWDEVLTSFAILREKGPHQSGDRVAKKLRNTKDLFELKASLGNRQPRLIFYERKNGELMFVDAFIKTGGEKDYAPAIKRANQRRKALESGNARSAAIDVVH